MNMTHQIQQTETLTAKETELLGWGGGAAQGERVKEKKD